MAQAKISVIMPSYNAAPFLVETLDSILSQGYPDLEIIVVDDGSTDNTDDVLAPYLERIVLVKQPNWGGPSRPRNVGLSHATGDLVAFFDSDDVMLPQKLIKSAAVFETYPDVDFVFTNFQGVDESGLTIRPDYLIDYTSFRADLEFRGEEKIGVMSGANTFTNLIAANFIGTSSVICRRRIFETTGNLDEGMLNSDDVDMWSRIAHAGFTFAFLPIVLHSYRMRAGGVTGRNEKRYPSVIHGIEKRINLATTQSDKQALKKKKNNLMLGYGMALHQVGKKTEARQAFSTALGERKTWAGIKGWLRALLGI